MIEVSIILTTYNRSSQLSDSIESILKQSFSNFELIICDDCSTDNTQEICQKFALQDIRIRYIRNEQNLKMPENLNNGIRLARGKYIANLHDGDIYRYDLIEKWKTSLDLNKEAAFVFNDYHENISTFGSAEYSINPILSREGQVEIALHFFKTFTSCVWGTVMVRKSVYDDVGLFNSEFGFISDVEMWLRITKKYKFAYIPEMLIKLTPREETHPYRYYHWKYKFWEFLILRKAQEYFEDLLPAEVSNSKNSYKRTITLNFLKTLISLVKNKQFERVKEGLSIFKDSPLLILRILGVLFNYNHFPKWYNKNDYWKSLYQ